ncbi:hypothetical protein NLO40_08575 [Escherichia coli]|nr:hypothetical protein [Escherichia coli]
MASLKGKRITAVIYDVKCSIAGNDERFTGETGNIDAIEAFLSITSGNPLVVFIPVGNDRFVNIKTIEQITVKRVLED